MAKNVEIGIVCLDTPFEKLPGHIRNQLTFPFPIRLRVVEGATVDSVINNVDYSLVEKFVEAAKALEDEGVSAVAGSCGFLALFQDHIARQLKVPFFSSSLLQASIISKIIGSHRQVGLIVSNKEKFIRAHLEAVGCGDVSAVVGGMEKHPEFRDVVLEGKRNKFEIERLRAEIVAEAKDVLRSGENVGAILFECTDLSPFAPDVRLATGVPVFDAITLVNWVHNSVSPTGTFEPGVWLVD